MLGIERREWLELFEAVWTHGHWHFLRSAFQIFIKFQISSNFNTFHIKYIQRPYATLENTRDGFNQHKPRRFWNKPHIRLKATTSAQKKQIHCRSASPASAWQWNEKTLHLLTSILNRVFYSNNCLQPVHGISSWAVTRHSRNDNRAEPRLIGRLMLNSLHFKPNANYECVKA